MDHSWIDRFAGLSRLDPGPKSTILAKARQVTLPPGTTVFGPDKSPENMLFLIDGTVRVQQVSDQGREIVLYRIHAGESCVLTTACLLSHEDYAAEGIAETDVTAAALPRVVFDDLVATSATFRTFVFAAFSKRMTDLFTVIEEVAFRRIDVRLAQKLLELAEGQTDLSITHQKLSVELGTAREVISRQLQEFHRRGWIDQTRGHVLLRDTANLHRLAKDRG